MDTPPVIDEDVENAERDDQEGCGPLGLEADCNHGARREADDRHEDTGDAPLSTEDEADEQEDEEYTSRKQEAVKYKVTWLKLKAM